MSRLNLDFRNAHPFLFFRDIGIRYPEMRKTVGITIISNTIFRMPTALLVAGSSTIQKEAHMPVAS